MFNSLTGFRFIAALLVLLVHTTANFAPVPGLQVLFSRGALGVSFFFILSGFLLSYTARPNASIAQFYLRRFARIYPMHLLSWGVVLLLAAASFYPNTWSTGAAISNLFLVQAFIPVEEVFFSVNGASWSLSAEAFFYLLFPILYASIIRCTTKNVFVLGVFIYLCAAVIAVTVQLAAPSLSVGLTYVSPVYRVWEFAIGLCAGVAFKRGVRFGVSPRVSMLVLLGCYLIAVLLHETAPLLHRDLDGLPAQFGSLVVVPAVILAIMSLAESDQAGSATWLASPSLVALGKWSFALYLIQIPCMEVAYKIFGAGQPNWSSVVRLGLFVLFTVSISALLYRWYEYPLERLLRERFSRKERTTPALA